MTPIFPPLDHERMSRFRKELENLMAGALLKLANEHGCDIEVDIEGSAVTARPLLVKAKLVITRTSVHYAGKYGF